MRYVLMPGQSYTGSTLLSFLTNAHTQMVSVGAAAGPTTRVDMATYSCSCGELLTQCPFWQKVSSEMAQRGHPLELAEVPWPSAFHYGASSRTNALAIRSLRSSTLNRIRNSVLWKAGPVASALRQQAAATIALADAICEITGSEVFVDSTRDPQRPLYLSEFTDADIRVIHLVRDPRANVASIMGHVPDIDAGEASRRWWSANNETVRVRGQISPHRWMTLRYEDLCGDPQGSMEAIARHVGVEPETLPVDFRVVEHHVLGNEMRMGGAGSIRLDESWREKLDQRDLAAVESRCRELGEALGYVW